MISFKQSQTSMHLSLDPIQPTPNASLNHFSPSWIICVTNAANECQCHIMPKSKNKSPLTDLRARRISHTQTPYTSTASDPEPVVSSRSQEALWRPTEAIDLVVAFPRAGSTLGVAFAARRYIPLLTLGAIGCRYRTIHKTGSLVRALVQQVPNHHEAVVATRSKGATP